MSEESPAEQPEEKTQEQTENRKPWLFKPGQSGNPGGRPKGRFTFTGGMERRLSSDPSLGEKLLDRLFELFNAGNPAVVKLVVERIDGLLTQKILISDAASMNVSLFMQAMALEPDISPAAAERVMQNYKNLLTENAAETVGDDDEDDTEQ